MSGGGENAETQRRRGNWGAAAELWSAVTRHRYGLARSAAGTTMKNMGINPGITRSSTSAAPPQTKAVTSHRTPHAGAARYRDTLRRRSSSSASLRLCVSAFIRSGVGS